jgi:hypothetical protein
MKRTVLLAIAGADDGPGWLVTPEGKIIRIPGWSPVLMASWVHGLEALRALLRIQANDLAEQLAAKLHQMIAKELPEHLNEGELVVLRSGGSAPAK